MTTIQWRPEANALTTPQSYWPRHIPRATLGNDELAARMEQRNPLYTQTLGKSFLIDLADELRDQLISGNQVTLADLFTCHISFSGRLEGPNDPLPPLEECLNVRLYPSKRLVEGVRQAAKTERLSEEKKLPLISAAEDTVLGLKEVLNPAGLLRLAGADMGFDRSRPDEGCVIENTAGGKTAQTRFGKIEDSEIILVPDLPAPPHPWNNEHTVSVSTRYSSHGTLRVGIYGRKLRSPLTVDGFGGETGILTGKAGSPYVSVTGGAASADETLRVQAVLDLHADALLFSLTDMREGGRTGAAVSAAANGTFTLPGFAGSAVGSLNIRVNSWAKLKEMVRNDYGGRVVDVLEVRAG